jgi:hypothetical protein
MLSGAKYLQILRSFLPQDDIVCFINRFNTSIEKDGGVMMKIEWKKQGKELYLPKNKPELVKVPPMKFFMLDGKGNPNSEEFSDAVGLLYSLSYTIKMFPKKGVIPQGYYEYTVFPLEGVWGIADQGKNLGYLDKNLFMYTIMIRQPDFVTEDIAQAAIASVAKKKDCLLLGKVRFETAEEGMCVQMMHLGSYDSEAVSFKKIKEFCDMNGLERTSRTHREIYISDPRKTAPEKCKTVLRVKVQELR